MGPALSVHSVLLVEDITQHLIQTCCQNPMTFLHLSANIWSCPTPVLSPGASRHIFVGLIAWRSSSSSSSVCTLSVYYISNWVPSLGTICILLTSFFVDYLFTKFPLWKLHAPLNAFIQALYCSLSAILKALSSQHCAVFRHNYSIWYTILALSFTFGSLSEHHHAIFLGSFENSALYCAQVNSFLEHICVYIGYSTQNSLLVFWNRLMQFCWLFFLFQWNRVGPSLVD